MTIKFDLHVHSKVSKAIPFRMEYFENSVARARAVGLNGFALTEHLHSYDFWQSIRTLSQRFPYGDGCWSVAPGFNVLSGAELTVSDGADIIVVGPLESLAWLDKQFRPGLNSGCFPRLSDLIRPARDAGLLLIGAHPSREEKRLVDVDHKTIAKLDALEINGKDVGFGLVQNDIRRLADALGLPVVGSSDAHLWAQVGVQRSVASLPELTQRGLRKAIASGGVNTETSPHISTIVRVCKAHKNIIKASLRAQKKQVAREAVERVLRDAVPVPVVG